MRKFTNLSSVPLTVSFLDPDAHYSSHAAHGRQDITIPGRGVIEWPDDKTNILYDKARATDLRIDTWR